MHLGRPSLPLLLGEGSGGSLLLPQSVAPPSGASASGGGGANGGSGGGGGASTNGGVGHNSSSGGGEGGGGASAAARVQEAWALESSGAINAQERQRRIQEAYEQSASSEHQQGQVGVEETLADVEVLGLYFAAAWCPGCRSTTPVLASAYKALRARGNKLQIVFVNQDAEQADFDAHRSGMPWPALPHGGTLPALLAEIFHVASIPCLVLLNKDGALISTDGVRLMRKHARAFPWSSSTPPETPHHHPLWERLMRREPVDVGTAHELPRYTPVDMLQQPAVVRTLDEAVSAVRHCDRLCTLVGVQAHCIKNSCFLKLALIQTTFTQLLPLPRPDGTPEAETCVWRSPMLYAQQLDLMLLLQRVIEHFAASVFTIDHTRSVDSVRMVVPACIAAVADAVMRQIAVDIPSEVSGNLGFGSACSAADCC